MLPDERLEMLLASIAALLANQWRDTSSEPATVRDFMPWLNDEDDEEPAEMDQAAMIARIEALNAAFGGRDLRNGAADGDDG